MAELCDMATSTTKPATILCHCGFSPANARLARGGRLALVGREHAGAFPPSWALAQALIDMDWTRGSAGDPPDAVGAHALIENGQIRCALDATNQESASSSIA